MKHIHYLDQEAEEVSIDGAHGTVMRHVITEKDGAPNFNMRVITMEPGGQSPNHNHSWEHEMFVLSGKGMGEVDGKTVDLRPNTVHLMLAF